MEDTNSLGKWCTTLLKGSSDLIILQDHYYHYLRFPQARYASYWRCLRIHICCKFLLLSKYYTSLPHVPLIHSLILLATITEIRSSPRSGNYWCANFISRSAITEDSILVHPCCKSATVDGLVIESLVYGQLK